MDSKKLIGSIMNDLVFYLLENDAHLVSSEVVSLENNFHIVIEGNIDNKNREKIERELKILSKMKDHPELKYYSSLSQLANGLEGIYVLAPYIKKLDFASDEGKIIIEIFVDKTKHST